MRAQLYSYADHRFFYPRLTARTHFRVWTITLIASLLPSLSASAEKIKVVEAEATYIMGESDTLATAEDQALLKAKRKAIEEAGIYLETTSQDFEKSSGNRSLHTSSLHIRTLAAAITETEVLEKRRSLDGEHLVLFVKIRAKVHVDWLEEAIRRLKANEQLAEHHRQLHQQYSRLKSEFDQLRKQIQHENFARKQPVSPPRNRNTAKQLLQSAIQTQSLPEKLDQATRAIAADDRYTDAYVIRGQTYLRIASLAFSKKGRQKEPEIDACVERAIRDFDQALTLDLTNTWALLGRSDALTWQQKFHEAADGYEHILELDPLFDLARQRLIALYTTMARRQTAAQQWRNALAILDKLLQREPIESWIAHQKEAYLLRSQVYEKLGEFEHALTDLTRVVGVDPTNAKAFLFRAQLYLHLKQGRLAKDDFERACVLGSDEACSMLP